MFIIQLMLQVTSHYILSIHMLNVEPVPSEFTGLYLTFFLDAVTTRVLAPISHTGIVSVGAGGHCYVF